MIFWKEKNGDGLLKFLYEIFQRKDKLSEKDSPFQLK